MTRRQLLPPNPSVKPSVIFFGPHHDGTAAVFADDVVAAVDDDRDSHDEREREKRSTSSSWSSCAFSLPVVDELSASWDDDRRVGQVGATLAGRRSGRRRASAPQSTV